MKKRKGFTLIEVLFVVVILAALAGLAIPRITRTIHQAKIDTDRANISIVNSQVELFRLDTGNYPTSEADFDNLLNNDDYFTTEPECPFGTDYNFNTTSNAVIPHSH